MFGPPQKPASLPGPWRLYSRHHPCPSVQIFPAASTLRTPSRVHRQAPRRRRLARAQLPARTTPTPASRAGAARARTFAAGVCLRAQRGAAGVGEAAARCSGSLHRLEKKKSKTNTPQMKLAPPPHSALLCSPPEGRLGRPPWAPSRISDRGPRSGQSWRGTAEEFASNTPDSLAFSLKPFRRAQGQLSADPSAPWERSGDAWLLAVSSLWSPGSSTGRIGLRAGCHLVKATGKGCFMGREKGQEVLLPSLATPGQSLNGGSPIWVWDAGRNKVGSETVGSSVRPLSV